MPQVICGISVEYLNGDIPVSVWFKVKIPSTLSRSSGSRVIVEEMFQVSLSRYVRNAKNKKNKKKWEG